MHHHNDSNETKKLQVIRCTYYSMMLTEGAKGNTAPDIVPRESKHGETCQINYKLFCLNQDRKLIGCPSQDMLI